MVCCQTLVEGSSSQAEVAIPFCQGVQLSVSVTAAATAPAHSASTNAGSAQTSPSARRPAEAAAPCLPMVRAQHLSAPSIGLQKHRSSYWSQNWLSTASQQQAVWAFEIGLPMPLPQAVMVATVGTLPVLTNMCMPQFDD